VGVFEDRQRGLQEQPVRRSPAAPLVWLWNRRYPIVYLGLAMTFILAIARFYDPQTRFTSLISFGDRFAARRLPQLHDVPLYTFADGDGYDGQFYAQIAVAGNPLDPGLRSALDSAPYRSRRVLLPVLAYLIGLGRPAWVVNVFALSNLICWWLLAWVLARWWFPPDDLHNLLRWVGTLFGGGMIVSVTHSLTDGPALLFIALGMRCLERNRGWLGAVLLALGGLVRETSVLCAAALLPPASGGRSAWLRAVARAAACLLPAIIWAGVLHLDYGHSAGARNFDLPLAAFVEKVGQIVTVWRSRGFGFSIRDEVWGVLALVVQVAFIACRPKPSQGWWRIGAGFAVLWTVLGAAVWEGWPSAATRAVLPLTLAFNILAPRTRLGLVLLVAGNLTVLSAPTLLKGVPSEQTTFTENIALDYGPGWYRQESLGRHAWRWARGSTSVRLHNPNPGSYLVTLDFGLRSVTDRTIELSAANVRQSIALSAQKAIRCRFGPVLLPPGDLTIALTSAADAWTAPGDGRRLAVAFYDLRGTVAPARNTEGP
jgi:hypothetical protein